MDKIKSNRLVMELKKHERRFADRGDVRRIVRIPTVKLDMETQMSEECLGCGDSLLEPEAHAGGGGGGAPSLQHGGGGGAGAGAKAFSGPNTESKEHKKELRTNNNITNKKEVKWMPFSIDRRRELAQKYTFSFKKQQEEARSPNPKNKFTKDEELFIVHDDSTLDASGGIPKQQRPETKPVIKNVMQKGTSITAYKAVSFEKKKSVPLRVHVPSKLSPTSPKSLCSKTGSPDRYSRSSDRHSKSSRTERKKSGKPDQQHQKPAYAMSSPLRTVSPTNSPKLSTRHKTKNHSRRKRTPSPEETPALIPLTEIAKWKPDTVDAHTKPYYEAWVNTKLSAISRTNDPQALMEKQQIIKQFQQALENAPPVLSPADMCDEAYAGRIRVMRRQKGTS